LYLRLETGLTSLVGLTYSDDGRFLAAVDEDGSISVWEMVGEGNHRFDIQVGQVLMVLFSPDNAYLATISADMVQLWLVEDGSLVADYPSADEMEMEIQFLPSGELAITGILDEEQANLTYLPSGDQQNYFSQNPETLIKEVALSPNGKVFALGRSDGVIELYDAANKILLRTIEAHIDWVLNLVFTPDSQLLASDSFSFDSNIMVWQVSDGTLLANPETQKWDAGKLSFSPAGNLLVSYSSYGTHLWKVEDWSLYAERPGFVRLSPDDVFLAEPEGNGASIWYVQKAALLKSLNPDGLRDVAFPPSQPLPLVALGMTDGTVEIYQLDLEEEPLQVLGTATPPPVQDLYALLEETYGELYAEQYVEWDESMQVYLVHGFVAGPVDFDPLPIQTREGEELGTAIATIRLINLHQGNQNSVLVPLAVELPDGTLFMPGLGDPIPADQHQDFLTYLREDIVPGRSITIMISPDIDASLDALGMPDMPWQDELIQTYQQSWQTEMDEMLQTGQVVTVDEQELMLVPFLMWFDTLEPLPMP